MDFVECHGYTPFKTMEVILWRETLGKCLGSHHRRDWLPQADNHASYALVPQDKVHHWATVRYLIVRWPDPFASSA